MNCKYTDYDNFDELMDCDSQTANLLLKELDLDESDTGDSTCCQLLPNGKVVTTNYGW